MSVVSIAVGLREEAQLGGLGGAGFTGRQPGMGIIRVFPGPVHFADQHEADEFLTTSDGLPHGIGYPRGHGSRCLVTGEMAGRVILQVHLDCGGNGSV